MKKFALLLMLAVMILTVLSCTSKKQSTAETTTDPAETTPELIDGKYSAVKRELFDSITPNVTTVGEFWGIFGNYIYESDSVEFRSVKKFTCTDGGYMYVEFTSVFDEEGEFVDSVVWKLSKEYAEPQHDKTLFENISEGTWFSEVCKLLDGDEGRSLYSGRFVQEYLCTDGSTVRIEYRSPSKGPITVESIWFVDDTDCDESGKPYKKLFEKLTPGTSVAKFKELLGGFFEHEDVYEGRNLRKYLCADGEIYVDIKIVFLEDGEVDLVVKSVSETCPPIPTHEKAVLEQITVGMKESEVYELLDDCGAWITSGVRTMEFLCTDGSKLRVQFDDFLDSVKLDYNVVKTVEFIEPKE